MTDAATTNIDWEKVKRAVSEIRRAEGDMESSKSQHMSNCKAARKRIKTWRKFASDAGLNGEALDFRLTEAKLQAKVDDHRKEAATDIVVLADQIKAALGDFASTPLGVAATGEEAPGTPVDEKPRGKARGRLKLVGEDDGSRPKMGADDAPKADGEARRKADAKNRLKGMKALETETQH